MTIVTSPAGCISIAEETFRDTLANCYYFQKWQGLDMDSSQALQRIYIDEHPLPDEGQYSEAELADIRPAAYVRQGEPGTETVKESTTGFRVNGTLEVTLVQNVLSDLDNDAGEAMRRFKNDIGRMIYTGNPSQPGLWDLSGQHPYMEFQSIGLTEFLFGHETEVPAQGHYQIVQMLITWGPVA